MLHEPADLGARAARGRLPEGLEPVVSTPEPADARRTRDALFVRPPPAPTAARDAIGLFTGPRADRIRACGADGCHLLFVDTAGPGRRRWCGTEHCGKPREGARAPGTQGP
ncbi:CGNR zinc finger domain-containing protein [Streptomyces sp. NPDC002566]|uniref:CGNR zinc finger domain-containing protein n=1 Tax=Streptomyces sp. NPDC002566 TaxID=3364650 RepID=UPI0036AE4B3B